MNHNLWVVYDDILLRPLAPEDIESLRQWRNDTRNTKFLSDIGTISEEKQRNWFQSYLGDKSEVIFAIEEIKDLQRIVGSVSLYSICGDIAEVGKILIGDVAAHGKGIGRKALVMAMAAGFDKLGLKKIIGAVSPDNVQAYTNDMRVGFQVVGQHTLENGLVEDEIEIDYERLKVANDYVDKLLLRGDCDVYYVGQMARFSKTITVSDVYQYAGICGDFNSIHINSIKAKDSVFGKQVCHGMLIASLISACIGTKLPGDGTVYLNQNLSFLKPVYIGDTCTACVEIKEIKHDNGILKLKTTVTNQEGELVIDGDAVVKVDKDLTRIRRRA